jgi:hypothetical protein
MGVVLSLFGDGEGSPSTPLDLEDPELELVIACGLALRDIADRLDLTMEAVCGQLIRFDLALRDTPSAEGQ